MKCRLRKAATLCPQSECEEPIDPFKSHTQNRSTWCDHWDRHVHSHCPGTFVLHEMDILTLRCECHCHRADSGSSGDTP